MKNRREKKRGVIHLSIESTLPIYIIILSSMIILRDIIGVNLSKYIFVVLCTLFFFITDKQNLIYMIMFTVPMLCGLPGNYIMPIAFFIYIIKKRYFQKKQFFFCLFIAFMEIFASAFYSSVDIPMILGYVTNLMLFFCLIYDNSEYDYKKCLFYYTLGILLVSLVIIISTISKSPTWLQDIASGYLRFGMIEHETEEALNLTLNANSLAMYSITGMSCCVVLLKGSFGKKIFTVLEIIFLALAGMLTLSRTWIIIAIILFLLYFIASTTSIKQTLKTLLGIGVLLGISFYILSNIPEVYEGMIARLTRADVAGGNGRVDITNEYLSLFGNNIRTMLFGTGVTQYRSIIGATESLHNSLVQILICYGIFGSFVFLYGWLSKPIKALRRVRLLYWIPFICALLFSLTLQIVNPHFLIYPHLMGIYALYLGMQENKKISHIM